mgnify:CR=1 FL=1
MARKRSKKDLDALKEQAVDRFCKNLEDMGWKIFHLSAAASEIIKSGDLAIMAVVNLVTQRRAIDKNAVEDTLRGLAEMFDEEGADAYESAP